MRETIEGQGELENLADPEKRWTVHYRFDITTKIVERPGLPREAAHKQSTGRIRSAAGENFAPGYYRLYAAGGEVLNVQSYGNMWVILAS